MPIIRGIERCEEMIDSRTGSPFKAGGRRDYQRKWLVKLTDNNLGANIVCQAPGVVPYAPYATEDGKEWDYQALCVDIRLEPPVDPYDGFHRIVVADYSTEMPQGGPSRFTAFGFNPAGDQNLPWLEPPHMEWDGETAREAPPYDLDRKAYVNSAFMPYKPAPTFPQGRAVFVYTRNQQNYDQRKQIRFSYAVNSDTFLGEDQGTVQLLPPRAVLMWRGTVSYWRVTYRFMFNVVEPPALNNAQIDAETGNIIQAVLAFNPFKMPLRSWQPQILDAGTMQLQTIWSAGPNFNQPVPIFRAGHPVTEAVLLDGQGREQKQRDANNQLLAKYNYYRQFVAIPFTPILVSGFALPF